ncbi:interferon lambda receptor 1 [Sphaeramia orbicularis]|uniref:Uncharacterized LOC115434857 n=1 Tax=Sphaeramia orbicularis TaxID=375764 RepID=A0A672ZRS7_9TELE|nr:uncharacterized protein LOC115434857 [Sphaeramia orbicularis]
MKSMSVLLLFICPFSVCCGCHENGNVSFNSRNFNNILRWRPAKPDFPGQKVLYSVRYKNYSGEYQTKKECQNITELYCDLTAETPSGHDIQYIAKVLANGRCHGHTTRFKPRAQTILGPPTLFIKPTRSSLYINVTLPLGPKGVSLVDIFKNSKKGPRETIIDYHLKITDPSWAAQDLENTTGQFFISVKHNQKYCGSVVYESTSDWGRGSSEAEFFCVLIPADPWTLMRWPLLGAALLATIVIISIWCTCNYVKGGKGDSRPKSLETIHRYPKIPPLDAKLSVSELGFWIPREQTVYSTIQAKSDGPVVVDGGYHNKQMLHQSWQDSCSSSVETGVHSPTPNLQDSSSEWSANYSTVVVHAPHEDNEDLQEADENDEMEGSSPLLFQGRGWDNGGTSPKLASHGAPPLTDINSCESNQSEPLLLNAVRDSNGQLVFPMFPFQIQTSVVGTAPLPSPERTPLLSDLIVSKEDGPSFVSSDSLDSSEWSDSGWDESTVNSPSPTYCNSHYCPTQPPNTTSSQYVLQSSYKKNWMPPEMHHGISSTDSSDYGQMNSPWTWSGLQEREEKEDGEHKGGDEESNHSVLGGWMVQIQE